MNSTVQLVFLIVLSVLIVGCIIGVIIVSRQNAFLQEQIDQLDEGFALERDNIRAREESNKKKKTSKKSTEKKKSTNKTNKPKKKNQSTNTKSKAKKKK